MIFTTLYYTLEELNYSGVYKLIKVNIDETIEYGECVIKDLQNNILSNWIWDIKLDIWIKSCDI